MWSVVECEPCNSWVPARTYGVAMNICAARDVRRDLRGRIDPLHHQLDQHPVMSGLANPEDGGRDAYIGALRFLAPFWSAFAQRNSRVDRLARALEFDVETTVRAAELDAVSLRSLHYVMWGSTLGIRSLAHRIPFNWPRQFVDTCLHERLDPPRFEQFQATDLQDVERVFLTMLEEANRYVATPTESYSCGGR